MWRTCGAPCIADSKGVSKTNLSCYARRMKVLCGDIGGTSTRLALYAWGDGTPRMLRQQTFRSEAITGLEEAIDAFCEEGDPIHAAGFGVAGPVSRGQVDATNLAWSVDASTLARRLKLPSVRLMNDLAALAYGADLVRSQWKNVQRGENVESGPRVFVGAGTGLGVAFEAGGEVHGSEGGHIGFAPSDDEEVELWRRATQRFKRASAERLVSGGGLPLIFEHYAERCNTAPTIQADVAARGGAAISEAARQGDEAAVKTLEKFVSLFGRFCGDLAILFRPRALLLAGGLTLNLSDSMPNFGELFLEAFHDKGRMRPLNERVGLHIVADESAALLGAASSAIRFAMSGNK